MPAEENKNRRASFMEIMKNRILSGELKPGDRLPPERELVRGLEGAEWLRLCGNCREIHPMIESVITEGKTAGYACVT